MKSILKIAIATVAIAIATPAFAGGVTVAEKGDSKLKLGGKLFSDVTAFKATDSTGAVTKKTTSARIERAYFTGKYYFNKDWMMRVTTDVTLDASLSKKNNNIFLKYAYLEGKLAGDAVVLRVGQSHTPWIDYEEELWEHRYFSKVLIDTNGYDASSDLGIGLKGKLADGMANYWVTYTSGAGYSHPGRVGSTMDIDARFGIDPIKGLTLDVQYRNGYKGTKQQPVNPLLPETKHTLYQVMATYGVGEDFRVGANYANNKQAPTAAVSVTEKAYSVWGWYNFNHKFGAFGRYENTKNDKAAVNKEQRFALGLEYSPVKNVTLALAYDETKKTLGGANNGKDTRYGLWTRTKF